jgi:aspartate/methionine/tyrosine aminotransferase
MEVLEGAQELQRAGDDVIHLEVGEPDFPTPEPVVDAGTRALRDGLTHYTHSLGILPLREAIAERVLRDSGVAVDPGQVVVTSGTSAAMLITFAALCDPGDQVILTDPHYACYPNFLKTLSVEPVYVPVDPEDGYAIDPDRVRAAMTPRTKALLINSPANPMGAVLSDDNLAALADLDLTIVSDEIYRGIEYGGQSSSMMRFREDTVLLDGFSKRYCMTGWRLGYVVAPRRLMKPLQALQQNLFISAAEFVQHAGLAALRDDVQDHVSKMVAELDARRRAMIDGARDLGLGVAREPEGAFYLFADASHLGPHSLAVSRRILAEAKVALAPGLDFGERGEGFLRLAYTQKTERIQEALDRIRRLLESW